MRKTLLEVKKLNNFEAKKLKKAGISNYLTLVLTACYNIFREEDKFQKFCQEENISGELTEKLKTFSKTQSFLNYVFSGIVAVTTNPEYTLQIPSAKESKQHSQNFALTIVRNLVEDLKKESVESLCLRADDEMRQFQEMNKANATPELIEKFGDIPI